MEQVFYYYDSEFGFVYDYNVNLYYSYVISSRDHVFHFAICCGIFLIFCYLFFLVFYLIKRYLL